MAYDLPAWSGGCVLGCLLDLDARELSFSMDGVVGTVLTPVFANVELVLDLLNIHLLKSIK